MKVSRLAHSCVVFLFFYNSLHAFKLGIENISDEFLRSLSKDKSLNYRVALVTNQTGQDMQGNRTVDILRDKKLNVTHIFTSEHGFDGSVGAEKSINDGIDKKTGIPVISLYKDGKIHTIGSEHVKNFDVLFFDMQDSGMRHYTKISTLCVAMKVASAYNRPIVVLDRPNPLGPHMEGPLVEPTLVSSISIAPVPLRHGMTIGEIAWFFNKHELEKPAQLHVVKMKDYSRNMKLPKLNVALSPNVHCLQSCYGYSFLGILSDIRPIDTAMETDDSFQCITLHDAHHAAMCPWDTLRGTLSKHGVQSSKFSYYSKRRKTFNQQGHQLYTGVRISIPDINIVKSFALTLDVIDFFKESGIHFSFSPSFDKAAGTSLVRRFCNGTCSRVALARSVNEGLEKFIKKAQDSFMYSPEPLVVKLN